MECEHRCMYTYICWAGGHRNEVLNVVALPALAPLLFAARVVCWPWLVVSELKVAFAFPTGCSARSPILIFLLVHQGQIVWSPCKMTKRQIAATIRHCLMFALAYYIDPASTTLLKTPWPTNFEVGFCCWWELEQQEETFSSLCFMGHLTTSSINCEIFLREFSFSQFWAGRPTYTALSWMSVRVGSRHVSTPKLHWKGTDFSTTLLPVSFWR
jgi:hypothetical protein